MRQNADKLPIACLDCGQVLDTPDRTYCDDCLPAQRTEAVTTFSMAGPQALAELRTQGSDPAHGGAAATARGTRNAPYVAAVAEWEREHEEPANPDVFARDILPRLQGVPLRAIAQATGLSEGYCSFVRRGQKVPHQRHWDALRVLIEESKK
jgi:hypothetical protein